MYFSHATSSDVSAQIAAAREERVISPTIEVTSHPQRWFVMHTSGRGVVPAYPVIPAGTATDWPVGGRQNLPYGVKLAVVVAAELKRSEEVEEVKVECTLRSEDSSSSQVDSARTPSNLPT